VPRALIATLPPAPGGVAVMLAAALDVLAERGYASTVAWYEPYSWSPRLSVPSFRLGTRRVGEERRAVEGAAAGRAIGAWLPELEFSHYWPTPPWRRLIAEHDLHLVVSGNGLAGDAFARTRTPFLAWLATDWRGDREQRARAFPWPRRWLDRILTRAVAPRSERRVLRAGHVVALSAATRVALDRAAGRPVVRAVVPAPIDLDRFRPDPAAVVAGRVGLAGRFDDPRKNVRLFLEAVAHARRGGVAIAARLIGAERNAEVERVIAELGLDGAVACVGRLDSDPYAAELRALDLLVVTSHQEGLGIAALEAMASGVPVVSTRCGGPEEFVEDGINGFLVGFEAADAAGRIVDTLRDRGLRARLAAGARRTVEAAYDASACRRRLGEALDVRFAQATRGRRHRG
jgi:glycosyltransferase involved in cell wall biosynthesis